ncbi:hypothetical protein LIER_14394 [Lithospermum erythrorhizon]|uniref:Tyrosinase copper-binding domain-containing protein n=1 Tax=Lithospermum erythrorhizon TaxID=34254 RepID=A0AAV3Q0Z4_LITER
MASIISPKPTNKVSHAAYSSSTLPYSSSTVPSLAIPSQFNLNGRFNKNTTFKVSCKANNNNNDEISQNSLDRRNVLLGLGGLYGSANLLNANNEPLALATPIVAPDVTKCGPAQISKDKVVPENCCPPVPSKIIDYVLPKPTVMRVRPPAHLLSKQYLAKFEKAVELMKALPEDDPRNFKQQAHIHCAYCNGSYDQIGFPDLDLQVHFSWLFFPFHRWYLYFYERILGKLIDDPTFGLPFWNWDTPRGMTMPAVFLDPKSPLYDSKRNQAFLPPVILDLKYDGSEPSFTNPIEAITNNLIVMYRQMVTNASTGIDFLGQPYVAGTAPSPGMGSIENLPHTPVHRWVGDPREDNREDMGNFYSAGNDVMFYSHHANVDRMWVIWQQLGGKKRREPNTPDFLDSSFLFYDENAQPVRVKTRDCINNKKMGFEYANVDIPWLKSRPAPRNAKSGIAKKSGAPKVANTLPAVLDKRIQVLVPRPRKSRSTKEKDDEEEILVIEGIEFPVDQYVKFDVFINDEDEAEPSFDKSEYLGSFANLPHRTKGKQVVVTSQRFGLSEPLEDLKAEDDDSVLVTLVPKTGDVKVGGIKIIFAS